MSKRTFASSEYRKKKELEFYICAKVKDRLNSQNWKCVSPILLRKACLKISKVYYTDPKSYKFMHFAYYK